MARSLASIFGLVRSRLVPAVALAALLGAVVALASAETIDPVDDGSQFAWGENVGWINAEPLGDAGPGVTVFGSKLTGWMYGENIGWINMHCENNATCGSVDFGVTNDGAGNLAGYAWAENVGWISFSCANTGTCATADYGVAIDPATGIFNGNAWGENIGWISFSDDSPVSYQVKTLTDSDLDGLYDADETIIHGTDPLDPDTDDDGYLDGTEVDLAKDPLTYCQIMRADVNHDGAVNIFDLQAMAEWFAQTVPPAPERYDQGPVFDDAINIFDLAKMADVFASAVSSCP